MKIPSYITLAVAGVAFAAPAELVQSDLPSILAGLANVDSTIKAFDTALTNLDKSKLKSELTSIGAKGDTILSTLLATNEVISSSGPLTADEAIKLAESAYTVSGTSNGTISHLVQEKAIFEQAGAAPQILSQLNRQKSATLDMITGFVSKIPEQFKSYATPAAKLATDALDKGILAFGGKI